MDRTLADRTTEAPDAEVWGPNPIPNGCGTRNDGLHCQHTPTVIIRGAFGGRYCTRHANEMSR